MNTNPFNYQDAIDRAAAEGMFDNLALAGKKIDLPSGDDPNWWIKKRLREDDVDPEALLPTVMILRREHDRMPETVAALRDERSVREYIEEYNERVLTDRTENPHPRMLAPTVDVDEWVNRWRQNR